MKQIALEGFLKKHQDVSRTIATAKMELFAALVSSFQPLTNFTKNPNIGAMGVLNAPLEYKTYSKICAGDQIRYCRTAVCNFSKDNLFHKLMNYLNSSNDRICISYLVS